MVKDMVCPTGIAGLHPLALFSELSVYYFCNLSHKCYFNAMQVYIEPEFTLF
jgi:hypothetical protein